MTADGGDASRDNLDAAKDRGVSDVAFPKKRGLAVADMTKSAWIYRKLRNFRAGIEAGEAAGVICLRDNPADIIGIAARGSRRQRRGGRDRRGPDGSHGSTRVHPLEAGAGAVPGASAARAGGGPRSDHVPLLRWQARQTRRDDHRNAGGRAAAMEEPAPAQAGVIQTVREKFTCRACEKITQPPAPFHVIPRGHVGPSLLAVAARNDERPDAQSRAISEADW
jgi:hypothetical protein